MVLFIFLSLIRHLARSISGRTTIHVLALEFEQPISCVYLDYITSTRLAPMSETALCRSTPIELADHPEPLAQLVFVSTTVLQQALDLVTNVLTDDGQLTSMSKFLPGSTIGKHLRHARDHFTLLLDCISGNEPFIFSYDTRSRNTPMESSLSEARIAFTETIARVNNLPPLAKLDQPMTLNAVTPFLRAFETTFGREFWFAGLHAVHHWSMVRVIAGEQGIVLPDDFGFAPSTLVYKGSDAPLGRAKI